jgi:hypothetical protein
MSPVVYNFNCYNFPGESDDDREELFVAANAARNARSMALDFIYLFISNFRSSPERHHFCFSFFFFFFFFQLISFGPPHMISNLISLCSLLASKLIQYFNGLGYLCGRSDNQWANFFLRKF